MVLCLFFVAGLLLSSPYLVLLAPRLMTSLIFVFCLFLNGVWQGAEAIRRAHRPSDLSLLERLHLLRHVVVVDGVACPYVCVPSGPVS